MSGRLEPCPLHRSRSREAVSRNIEVGWPNGRTTPDHFAPNASDETWLEAAGQRGWIALTHDRRIRSKPNELAAVMRYGVALLVIIGKAPYPELARSFVATLPRVQRFVVSHKPPYIAKVYGLSPAEAARPDGRAHRIVASALAFILGGAQLYPGRADD